MLLICVSRIKFGLIISIYLGDIGNILLMRSTTYATIKNSSSKPATGMNSKNVA